MKAVGIMGIDQYGHTYHGLENPRKDLMARIGSTHAEKMYRENGDGTGRHVGYVIGGLWVELYRVAPWTKEGARCTQS